MSSSLPKRAVEKLLEVGAPLADEGGLDAVDAGRYELVRELGRGGMGVVYEAHDPELGRRVALKLLSQPAGLPNDRAREARQRFVREARAAAQLTHPNIAAVYEATPEAIAMQLVDGRTLGDLRRVEPRLLAELMRDAALAVHTAHQQGIVHRDLKPANLMVEERLDHRPHVYVMDFGLAKAADLDASLSSSGGILGTPSYMSPEQAAGGSRSVDARTDVYSLGATFYAALAGRPPFEGEDVYEVLKRTVEEEPPGLARLVPDVDRDLVTIVMKCLEKEPERRYPSALALASDLDRWLRGEPIQARPVSAGYRLRKYLARRRLTVKASLAIGLLAAAVVVAVLLPNVLSERAERKGAERAMVLANQVRTILADAESFVRASGTGRAYERLEEGIAACRAFVEQTEIGHGYFFLGRLLRAQSRFDEALAAQERALELQPELVAARFERGLLRALDFRERRAPLGQRALPEELEVLRRKALADLAVIPAAGADHAALDLLLGRALVAFLEEDIDTAEELLIEVLQYDTTHAQAHLTLSRIFMLRGDSQLAMHHAVRGTDVLRGFGAAYVAMDQPGMGDPTAPPPRVLPLEGVRGFFLDFQGLVERRPTDGSTYGNRAQLEIRRAVQESVDVAALAAYDAAVLLLDSALTTEPGLMLAYNNRGLVHMQRDRLLSDLGDYAGAEDARRRALADLDEAVRLDARNPAPRANRGLLIFRRAQLAFLGVVPEDPEALLARARSDLRAALEAADEKQRGRFEEALGWTGPE